MFKVNKKTPERRQQVNDNWRMLFQKKLVEVWRVGKEAAGTQQNNTLTFH